MGTELLEITHRRRRDALGIVSPGDFRTGRGQPVEAARLLEAPGFSLYCLDEPKQRAIFVQTPADVDLVAGSFYYQAQFENAVRLLAVPYVELQALLDRITVPLPKLILIYSVGRCGSSLVSRMLGEVEGCLSVREPDVFTQLVGLGLAPDVGRRRLRMVLGSMAIEHGPRRPSHLALKFRSFAIEQAALAHELFPSARLLFMYRDATQTVTSGMRVYRYPGSLLGGLDALHRLPLARDLVGLALAARRAQLTRLFPAAEDIGSRDLAHGGGAGMLALGWISVMRRYLELHANGLPIVAFRYEDLLAGPEALLRRIFDHCRLDRSQIPIALRALDHDSQRDSPLALGRQDGYQLDDAAHATIGSVFRRSFPPGGPDFVAPGTLLADQGPPQATPNSWAGR